MAVFTNGGQRKSITLLAGFCVSFLLVIAHVLAYMFTADWVAGRFPGETGGVAAVWGPPMLISFVAALLCCSLMLLLKNKLLIPVAYGYFIVYYLVFLVALFAGYTGAERAYLLQPVNLYLLPPALAGNLLSWGIYLLLRRRNT